MKYISTILIIFIIFGCQKDEQINPTDGLWSEGFPYDADKYVKIPEYSSKVIHKDGYTVDSNWETGESYTGYSDPALRSAIAEDLEGHVPENRKDYYLSFLDNENFQKAFSPLSARRFLGAMSEGRYDFEQGEWIDPNGMKQISQDALDWATDSLEKPLVISDNERPDINPGMGSGFLFSVWPNYYHPNNPDSGRNIVVWNREQLKDASPMTWMSWMADEMPSSLSQTITNVGERVQSIATLRMAQNYASLYGVGMFKDGSKAGTRLADQLILSSMNGVKSTPAIEDRLEDRYLVSDRSTLPPAGSYVDANTIEELITVQQSSEGSNGSSEAAEPWTNRFLSHLFKTPVTNYSEQTWRDGLNAAHTHFDNQDNRTVILEEIK